MAMPEGAVVADRERQARVALLPPQVTALRTPKLLAARLRASWVYAVLMKRSHQVSGSYRGHLRPPVQRRWGRPDRRPSALG